MLADDFVWRSGGPLKMPDIREEREERVEIEEVLRWCLRAGLASFSFEKIEINFIVK